MSGPSSDRALLLPMTALFSPTENKLVSTAKQWEAGSESRWCHQNAASVPWPWFSNAYACQSCYCAASTLTYQNNTSCKLHSSTDASSLTAAGGKGRNKKGRRRERQTETKKTMINLIIATASSHNLIKPLYPKQKYYAPKLHVASSIFSSSKQGWL